MDYITELLSQPYEIVRAILLAPLGKRVSPVKSWGRITNFRVRVIRQSLSWAVVSNHASYIDHCIHLCYSG